MMTRAALVLPAGHRCADNEHHRHLRRHGLDTLHEIAHGQLASFAHHMTLVFQTHQIGQHRRGRRGFAHQARASQRVHLQVFADLVPVTDALERGGAQTESTDQQIAADHLRHASGLGLASIQMVALADTAADHEIAGGPLRSRPLLHFEGLFPEIRVAGDRREKVVGRHHPAPLSLSTVIASGGSINNSASSAARCSVRPRCRCSWVACAPSPTGPRPSSVAV